MKTFLKPLFLLLVISFFSIEISAQTKLSVQGVIRLSDGNAVDDGLYSVTFKLYDTLTTGNLLWTEVQPQVKVTSGIYSTILGEVEPLDLPFDEFYFLSLSIDGEELTPRAPLTSAPYANSMLGFDNVFPSTGNVGAGTLNPVAKFNVEGDGSSDEIFRVSNDINTTKDSIMVVTAQGRVGIGTASPTQSLEVNGNIKANNMLTVEVYSAWLTNAADFSGSSSGSDTNLKYTNLVQNTNTSVFSMNNSTGVLTILKAGVINLSAQFDFIYTTGWTRMDIRRNGSIQTRPVATATGTWATIQGHLIRNVVAGDQITITAVPSQINNMDNGIYSTLDVQWTGVN